MSSETLIGAREYFPDVGAIGYEGADSDNPLAFKYYDADRKVAGKTLRDHLRFSLAYWHSFCGAGSDPFGAGTRPMPWVSDDPMQTGFDRLDAAFEFITKLGMPYYCFHDRDLAPEGATAPLVGRWLSDHCPHRHPGSIRRYGGRAQRGRRLRHP